MNLNEINSKIKEIEEIKNAIISIIEYCKTSRHLNAKNIPIKILKEKLEEIDFKLQDLKNNANVQYTDMEYINKLLEESTSE